MRNPVIVFAIQISLLKDIMYIAVNANDASNDTNTGNAKPGFSFFFKTLGHENPNNLFNPIDNPLASIFKNQQKGQPFTIGQHPAFSIPQHGLGLNTQGFTIPQSGVGFNQQGFTIPQHGVGLNQQGNPFLFQNQHQEMNPVTTKSEVVKVPVIEFSSIDNTEFDDTGTKEDCELSLTKVNTKKACRGTVIFKDDFQTFDDSKWTKEQLIPSYSSKQDDMVFNYFDGNNVEVNNNVLEIIPKIKEDDFVRRGHLKLDNCTGTIPEECEKKSVYQWILPPVSSGRITTKNSFSFKYGYVEIVAKVPSGDWLIPELWLVPKNSKYGPGLESGRMVMAMTRGNKHLNWNGTDLGNRVLESSLFMSSEGKIRSRTLRVKSEEPWYFHYHKYIFTWRPDKITVSVDGISIGDVVNQDLSSTLSNLMGFSSNEEKKWLSGSAVAPFDEEFYLSIGLSVGGRDFPDNSVSRDYTKPWKSRTVKEMLDFWRAKDKWAPTWADNQPRLKILRIKVKSL